MKKTVFLLVSLFFLCSLCTLSFAQQPKAQTPKIQVPAAIETKTLTGKVELVTLVDPVKGTKSEIVVVDEKGLKTTLSVKPITTIYDANFKTTSLDKILKGDSVKVKYVTKEGVHEASSITVTPAK